MVVEILFIFTLCFCFTVLNFVFVPDISFGVWNRYTAGYCSFFIYLCIFVIIEKKCPFTHHIVWLWFLCHIKGWANMLKLNCRNTHHCIINIIIPNIIIFNLFIVDIILATITRKLFKASFRKFQIKCKCYNLSIE